MNTYEAIKYTINMLTKASFDRVISFRDLVKIPTLLKIDTVEQSDAYSCDMNNILNTSTLWGNLCDSIEGILNSNSDEIKYRIIERQDKENKVNTCDYLLIEMIYNNNTCKLNFRLNEYVHSIYIQYSPVLQLNTSEVLNILSDKIIVASSDDIIDSVEILHDIYDIISAHNIKYSDLIQNIKVKYSDIELKQVLNFETFEKLKKAYESLIKVPNRIEFADIFLACIDFMLPLYAKDIDEELFWNPINFNWEYTQVIDDKNSVFYCSLYCNNIRPYTDSITSLEINGVQGLLGVESATEYWGMSTFYSNSILLFNDETQDNEGYRNRFSLIGLFVPNVNTENVVKIQDGLYVTDREQTVCDMVRYKRHEFHLYETVISAYDDHECDIERLERLAESYGILDELHEIYKEALIAEEEDANC